MSEALIYKGLRHLFHVRTMPMSVCDPLHCCREGIKIYFRSSWFFKTAESIGQICKRKSLRKTGGFKHIHSGKIISLKNWDRWYIRAESRLRPICDPKVLSGEKMRRSLKMSKMSCFFPEFLWFFFVVFSQKSKNTFIDYYLYRRFFIGDFCCRQKQHQGYSVGVIDFW